LRNRRTARKSRWNKFVAAVRRKFVRLLILVAVAFFVFNFIFGDHGLYQLYKIKTQKKAAKNRITELKTEKTVLTAERKRLQTDLNYIEKLAREKYRMAKVGEKVFKVIPKNNEK